MDSCSWWVYCHGEETHEMDYPVYVGLPNGRTVAIRDFAEHIIRMTRCRHVYGWPPGVCVLCLSAEYRA